jgi:hypothetical protein
MTGANCSRAAKFDDVSELLDDLTPDSFARAVGIIEEAAGEGDADAICQLATIEAVGAGRARNFEKAFELLRRAAALGSSSAARQVELLGGADVSGLPALLAVPDKRVLSESPLIRVIDRFCSPEVCDWIVERSRGKLGPAMIWDVESRAGKVDPSRTNSAAELRLNDMDVVIAVQRARISAASRLPEPIFETPQVMRYSVGQEFRVHHDYLDPARPGHALDMEQRGQRIATFLVYLNDDFDGGETEFPKAGISFRGNKGDALFFANVSRSNEPDRRSIHAGKPPTSGEKWILSQWIRDRAPSMSPVPQG